MHYAWYWNILPWELLLFFSNGRCGREPRRDARRHRDVRADCAAVQQYTRAARCRPDPEMRDRRRATSAGREVDIRRRTDAVVRDCEARARARDGNTGVRRVTRFVRRLVARLAWVASVQRHIETTGSGRAAQAGGIADVGEIRVFENQLKEPVFETV